ncbi:unnamed protein product [Lactuca saligna]|uniref:Eukaryotic translation initiation factor 5B n=1 Tax=Lactuca saligna TaxID=75948 RepID=A0AA35Y4L9_LACSI|nr:unnamed protein product [Lactuca saligna]
MKVFTFQLKGEHHRLTYEELDSIMGIDDPLRISPQNQEYQDFLRYPDANFWMQISGLATFNPSRQRAKHIVHPCWRIAHRVLTTSIFGRLEPGQINRCELFFLRSMRRALPLSFSSFFLDKCDSIRQRSSGEIFIGGLITIIGRAVGLDFPDPEYIPVDTPPNFLLDCDTLIRMEMLLDRGTRTYSDPDTWLPPDQLTQAGVFPEFGDDEGDDAEQQEEEDDEENDEMPEAEDHFDQPSMQQPMFLHDQFQAPPHHFDQPHQQEGHEVPPYSPPPLIEDLGTTIDVVLVNGVLHEGDEIVVCGFQGSIHTTIRSLLTPHLMKELRVKKSKLHNGLIYLLHFIDPSPLLSHVEDFPNRLICGTLLMETQDGGDVKGEVSPRDIVYTQAAGGEEDPNIFHMLDLRFEGISWRDDSLELIYEDSYSDPCCRELLMGLMLLPREPDNSGNCEQIFLELMKVPCSEAKLIVYSYKLQFSTQVSELRDKLNIVYLSVEHASSL